MIRVLQSVFAALSLLFFLLLLLLVCINPLLRIQPVRTAVFSLLSGVGGYRISAGAVRVDYRNGLHFTLDDFSVTSAEAGLSLKGPRAYVAVERLPIGSRRGAVTRLRLFRPRLNLSRDFFSGDRPEVSLTRPAFLVNYCEIEVAEGEVVFPGSGLRLRRLNIHTGGEGAARGIEYSGLAMYRQSEAVLRGRLRRVGGRDDPGLRLHLKTDGLPLTWIPPLSGFVCTSGNATLTLMVEQRRDTPLNVRLTGELHDAGMTVGHGSIGEKPYRFDRLAVALAGEYRGRRFALTSGSLVGSDFSLALAGELDFTGNGDPRLGLTMSSNRLSMAVFKRLFPDPLVADWLPQELFPRFSTGWAELRRLSLQGRLSEIAHMDLGQNRNVLGLDILLGKTRITLEDDIAFSDCSGRVLVNGGKLEVGEVHGVFRQSRLEGGSLTIPDLYEDDILSIYMIPGRFSLDDLLTLARVRMVPADLRQRLSSLRGSQGLVSGSVELEYRPSRRWPRLRAITLSMRGRVNQEQGGYRDLRIGELKVTAGQRGRIRLQGSGTYGDFPLSFSGYLFDNFNGSITLHTELPPAEILAMVVPEKRRMLLETGALLPVRLTVNHQSGAWKLTGTVALGGPLSGPGFRFRPRGKELRLDYGITIAGNGPVKIDHLRLLNDNSVISGEGSWEPSSSRLSLWLKSPGFSIQSLELITPEATTPLSGRLAGDLHLELGGPEGDGLRLFGSLLATGFRVILPGSGAAMNRAGATLVFRERRLQIDNGLFFLEGSGEDPVSFRGRLQGWSPLQGEILMRGGSLDLSEMVERLTRATGHEREKALPGNREREARISIRARVDSCKVNGFQAAPLRLTGHVSGGSFFLDRLLADVREGMIGVAVADSPRGEDREISLFFQLAHMELAQLDLLFPGIGSKAAGALSMEGLLTTRGRSRKEFIAHLKGPLTIEIRDGEVFEDHVMLSIMEMLSIEKLVRQRPQQVRKDSFYFSTLKAAATIENGIMAVDNLLLDSFAFNGAAKGKIDLRTLTMDGTLAVSPFGTADYLVSGIPLVGYILTGPEKSLVSYYFHVHGPLLNPEVEYTPLKNIPDSLLGYVKRILLTPAQIFQDFSTMHREFDERHAGFIEKIDRELAHALAELPR